jgi:hypothetical protein
MATLTEVKTGTYNLKATMYGLHVGDEVEFTGLPKSINGVANPLIEKTGIVLNIQENDIDVFVEGYTDEYGTGFNPANLILKGQSKAVEEKAKAVEKKAKALIAVDISSGLQDFRENHEYSKNKCQQAIAKNDFVQASRLMHESMIWQYNQGFANCFTVDQLDNRLGSLMINLLATDTNPRAADLAQQDAWKEQYRFCLYVKKIIDRSKT